LDRNEESMTPRTLGVLTAALFGWCMSCHAAFAQNVPPFSLERSLAFPTTELLTAAPTASRIAWVFDERGVRNVWSAKAPEWHAFPLTQFKVDEGKIISDLAFSANASRVVFVRNADRGNWPPPEGMHPNPQGLPAAQPVEIWVAAAAGGRAWKVADGGSPAISPDGNRVAFLRDGQVFICSVREPVASATPKSRSEQTSVNAKSLFVAQGKSRELAWSPDGKAIAFVSGRSAHDLLGVFRSATAPIQWIAPSTHQIASPRWSPDGKRLAFVKLPGAGGKAETVLDRHPYPFEIWVADVAGGEAHVVWKSPRTIAGSYPDTEGQTNLSWGVSANDREAVGDLLLFTAHMDNWPHLYSLNVAGGEPKLLTPGNFMVEQVSISPDHHSIVYSANAGPDPADGDRRHVYRIALSSPQPTALTSGVGLEWSPVVTGDGKTLAVISAGAKNSPLPAILPLSGGDLRRLASDRVPSSFAGGDFVVPRKVTFQAADGWTIHGQLFQRETGSTSLHPALIFLHGGPSRQMLLGFHNMPYYARDYAMNQYLTACGFVVLAVNYRLGIGYGDAFSNASAAGTNGASEYQDVLAGAKYLQSLPKVDAKRIGIWGGSYGGYLTALALARNSDIFAAGVDIHGMHDLPDMMREEGNYPAGQWQNYDRPPDYEKALKVAWDSSPVASMEHWHSPILLIHGDDDRNVQVSQTVDIAERLRDQGVRFEELIIPDETHEWLLFSNVVIVTNAAADFLTRELHP
jgi:dipeptidyl aminopeptidase/acylaminoacyl peptidase